jgi:predicted acyltransferase
MKGFTVKNMSAQSLIGCICIVSGLVWSAMFPKTHEILRPDFVASVAIGLGLIISGVIILFFRKSKSLVLSISIILVWSLLLNVFLFSYMRETIRFIHEFVENTSTSQTSR